MAAQFDDERKSEYDNSFGNTSQIVNCASLKKGSYAL